VSGFEEVMADWQTRFAGPHHDGEALPPHHAHCLACGPANPHGHHLQAVRVGDEVIAEHVFDDRHVGAPGIAHGGAVATVLDDIFGFQLYLLGTLAVTRRLEVTYHSPVRLGTSYVLTARLDHRQGRKLHLAADVHGPDGENVAEATALFLTVDAAHFGPPTSATQL
jgi:acyl-coenzyme A thioesterase PaaI-like protein